MSRKNFFQDPPQPEPALGMDTSSPLQAMPPGFVRSLKNGRPGLEGGFIKRKGYATVLSSAWDTRSITAGIEYKNSVGSRVRYLFGTDGSASGGKIGYIDSGAVTEVSTGLSGTARPSFFQFDNQLFFVNGSDAPVVIADTTAKQMGITAPASAPSAAQGTAGSLVQTATYLYAYTYYNAVTGAESTPSALLSVTLTGTNDDVTLTILAGSSATADTIRVYRSYANGNQLYLEGTAAIGATSYNSTVADSALQSTQLELDNTRITTWSGTPSCPAVVGNRVWLKTGDNESRYSKLGQAGAMPESFPVTNFVDTTGTWGANDSLVGQATAGERVIFLKERSVGTADQIGYPDPSLARESSFYLYRELSKSVGAAHHAAAVDVLGECIFLGRDNIYGTRGEAGDVRPVANSIQATIRALGFTASQTARISAINDVAKHEVRFQVFLNSSATHPDYVLVGDYAKNGPDGKPLFRWSWDTPGENTSTHPGIRAGCYFEVTEAASGLPKVYFGGVANGQVYELHSGETDAGLGIYFEYIDRPRTGPTALVDKLWKESGFFASGDGSSYSLSVASIYDLSSVEEDAQTISLASSGSLWDNFDWDVGTWGTDESRLRRYQTHRKAKHRQLVIRQTSASAPVTLFDSINTGSVFRNF